MENKQQQPRTPPRWLNIAELARRAGVTRPTVYRFFRGEYVFPHNAEAIKEAEDEMKAEREAVAA